MWTQIQLKINSNQEKLNKTIRTYWEFSEHAPDWSPATKLSLPVVVSSVLDFSLVLCVPGVLCACVVGSVFFVSLVVSGTVGFGSRLQPSNRNHVMFTALERCWYASYVTFWFYCFGLVNYWSVCELKICRNSRHIFAIFVYIVQVVCCFCSILFINSFFLSFIHSFIYLFIYLFIYFLEPYTYPVTTNQSEKTHTHKNRVESCTNTNNGKFWELKNT